MRLSDYGKCAPCILPVEPSPAAGRDCLLAFTKRCKWKVPALCFDIHISPTVLALEFGHYPPNLLQRMELPSVIESLLVASEEPITAPELARLVRSRLAEIEDGMTEEEEDYGKASELADDLKDRSSIDEDAVIEAIAALNRKYERGKRSFSIIERAKGWKIYTRPEYGGFVRQLFPGLKPRRLSPPAMETLAIIAYRQPVTKASIDHVRGVSSDSILQKLLDRELIKIAGRADLPGRPLLYSTTDFFFEHFGIKSINELPNAEELRAVELPEPPEQQETNAQSSSNDEPVEEKQLALAEPPRDNGSDDQHAPDFPTSEE